MRDSVIKLRLGSGVNRSWPRYPLVATPLLEPPPDLIPYLSAEDIESFTSSFASVSRQNTPCFLSAIFNVCRTRAGRPVHTFVTRALSERGKPGWAAAMGADTVAQPNRSKLTGFTTELRRSGFESLGPKRKDRTPAEALLPPPDFDSMVYPRGWAVGKKRKLVNVDVVESMRRIAIQEMNRKDCEIDGLNEQLEEDCKAMERLQLQLQQERAKRLDAERENAWLHDQVGMLMNMLNDNEGDNTETPQSPVK